MLTSGDGIGSILRFAWYKVVLFYIIAMFSLGFMVVGIWGWRKDKQDMNRVIPINQNEIIEPSFGIVKTK
jgi:hypothetical protein